MSNANRLDPVTLRWAQKQMQAKAAVAVPGSLLRLTFGALADLFAIEAAEADRLAQAPQAMALKWRDGAGGGVHTTRWHDGKTCLRVYSCGGFAWHVGDQAQGYETTLEAAKARCAAVAAAMFGELPAKTMALTQASDVYVVTWHFYTEGGGDLSGALAVFDTEDAADAERNRLQALKPQSHTGYLVYDRDRKRAEPLITDGCTGFDVSKAGFTIARKVTP